MEMLAHHEKLRPNFSSFPLEILFSFSPFFAILVLSWFSFFSSVFSYLRQLSLNHPLKPRNERRLDYYPLFGKWARAPPSKFPVGMIEDQTRENIGNRALSEPYFLILDKWASPLRRLFLYTSFSCASWSACSSCSFFDSISSSSCLFFSSAWEKNLQEIIRQSTRGEGEWGSIFRSKVEEKVKGVKIV